MNELDVLGIVSERLTLAEIPFMLTGSYAMAHYITPRMTRDIDLVVALGKDAVSDVVRAFSEDFYVDADDVRRAVETQRMFNILHLESGIKVDLIIRKGSEYRQVEFARRKAIEMGPVKTWIVSREDLILSKLVWARDSNSELQLRDVRALLYESIDRDYMEKWAARLGVAEVLKKVAA
jgi:Domain of unknown function (DUF1814).